MYISGIARCDFKAKDSGDLIQGFNIYFSEPISSSLGVGEKSLKVFCSARKMSQDYYSYFEQKTPCVPLFNRYGKFDCVILL